MKNYDPMQAPDSTEWHNASQSGHMTRIEKYHRQEDIVPENLPTHVYIHLMVENQLLAPGGDVVRETFTRLIKSGLDRHSAIHVIGSLYLRYERELPRPHPDAIDWDSLDFPPKNGHLS